MSYIISDRQLMASEQKKAKYVPYRVHLDSFEYKEADIPFGHPLYTFVAEFTEISPKLDNASKDGYYLPIIPDGCTSIIITFNESEIKGYFCGVVDEIHKIKICKNEIAFIARYLPGMIGSFLDEPISTYTNRCCSFDEVLSNYNQLYAAFGKTSTFEERIYAFTKIMRPQRLSKKDSHYLLVYCVNKIYDQNGNIKISELSKETGFSERYIGKIFEQWVGISPKLYAEIIRFQFSLDQMEFNEVNSNGVLMDTALDSGFFDHAHMNRCYQRFLHCTTGMLSRVGFGVLDLSSVPKLIV